MATSRHRSRKDDGGNVRPPIDDPDSWEELAKWVRIRGAQYLFNGRPRIKIGRFDAQIRIGRGGFGMVFKVFDPEFKRWVALKLCLARSPSATEGLMEEASVLAKLRHPNIVTVYEPGEHDGAKFFVMPYIDGQNAAQFARREPRPTWRQVVKVYCGVAKGLAAAHAAGIAHGDVKPSNILLDRDDFPYIADFGLARRVIEDADESEQEGLRHRAGTLCYMAPEVLRGERGDALSDQWSFFVSLVQTLLDGALPFDGESSGELLEAIKCTEVHFDDPTIPQGLVALVRIGLSEDRSERFPNMEMVAEELERLLQSTPDESTLEPSAADEPGPEEPPEFQHAPAPAPPPEPKLVGEREPTRDELELVPLQVEATARTSKPKLWSFAAFALAAMSCVMLGWVGRGRVEVEAPRVSEPIPLDAPSPCALEETNPTMTSDVLLITCSRIRAGDILGAGQLWKTEFTNRQYPPPGAAKPTYDDLTLLRAQTLIVARTIDEQAERYHRWAWVTRSVRWTAKVLRWPTPGDPAVSSAALANEVRALLELPAPEDPNVQPEGRGPEDPDPQSTRERIQ